MKILFSIESKASGRERLRAEGEGEGEGEGGRGRKCFENTFCSSSTS